MSILKAYTLPHPPLAVPEVGKGQEKEISETLKAYQEVAKDIAAVAPETIIYITPHSTMYSDYFHISPGERAFGDFARFGAPEARIDTQYDTQLVAEIERIAKSRGISAGTQGEKDSKIDHAVLVPMWYINKEYSNYKSIRISQSGMGKAEHYMLGQILRKASDSIGRKVVVIGSSDLSHRLKRGGPYSFAPEGALFDREVINALEDGDFYALLNIPEDIREEAGECGYNSLVVLAGLFDCFKVDARLLSYEGPFGVGYAVAEFTQTGSDDSCNMLDRYLGTLATEVEEKRNAEDGFQKLARQSLEHAIRTGGIMPVPNWLPDELLKKKAGVFVSLHKNGKLRGCIGTIAPSTKCIAKEIIQNAVSAGLSDPRFDRVTSEELPYLIYKVDVLSPPEKIKGPDELDAKRYGVIVTSGTRRGLLLPNLDGVDTVEEQIDIARSKGGISKNEPIELERFEVVRHGE